ncbi:hypothetical protein [Nonomuraea sp. NPDC052265]|uniref:hypothetical protein n=1 Tax=Nonomuraea sp. NPDC052265 TaxID=3364374 RepID=UPI0037C5480D
MSAEELRRAAEITPIAAVQNMYDLATRRHEDVADHAAAHGIAFHVAALSVKLSDEQCDRLSAAVA